MYLMVYNGERDSETERLRIHGWGIKKFVKYFFQKKKKKRPKKTIQTCNGPNE